MKLVYLSSVRLPTKNAHGFQIMNMCSAFASQYSDVLLLVPWRENLLKEDTFQFYNLPRAFRIVKLPAIDLYPLRFIPERISSTVHLFSFFISARIYLWFHTYDILFTRETFTGLFFKNFVFEVHMPEQMKSYALRAKKLVVLTGSGKDEIIKKGISPGRILIAPDAVNLSLFPHRTKKEAREHLNLPLDARIVLYWGNFKLWKGVDTLANVAPLLKDTFVVMIGATKDSDLERIKNLAGNLPNTLIKGFKPQELLPWYLASADVLVLPNSAHDENSRLYTSPMKLFEYMAADRPIVASDLPSLRYIINFHNSVLVTPDDVQALARGIERLLADPAHGATLASTARKEVEQYTWEKRAQSILTFISE